MLDQSDQWLRDRRRSVSVCVLLAAALVRLAYFLQLAPTPLVWMHRLPARDMNYFDSWAKLIAHGDVLCRTLESPLHGWHLEIAHQFGEKYPERVRELGLPADLDQDETARKLWNHWCPPGRFYQEPLYPYFVGIVYAICGESPLAAFALQLATGCLSCWLIYAIGALAFGETCGFIAAIAAILCPQMLFYEMVLHRTCLITFFGLLLCWQMQRADSGRRWFWTGLMAGIALLLQTQFAVTIAAAFAAISVIERSDPRRAARWCVLFAIGIAIGLLPLAARNLYIGAPPLAAPTGGYLTFIGANTPDYVGPGFSMSAAYAPDLIDRSHGSIARAMLLTYQLHPQASTFIQHFIDRFWSVWHWFEVPNNENLYFFELYAPVLCWLPTKFVLIAPLGAVGLLIGLRKARAAWPLYAVVGMNLLVQVIFFSMARYRAPMTVALIPFAALTAVDFVRRFRESQWKSAACIAFAVALLAAFIARPLAPPLPLIYLSDTEPLYKFVVVPSINAALERGDSAAAADLYDKYIAAIPPEVERLARDLPPVWPTEPVLGEFYRDRFQDGARLMMIARRPDRANELTRRVSELDAALQRPGGPNH